LCTYTYIIIYIYISYSVHLVSHAANTHLAQPQAIDSRRIRQCFCNRHPGCSARCPQYRRWFHPEMEKVAPLLKSMCSMCHWRSGRKKVRMLISDVGNPKIPRLDFRNVRYYFDWWTYTWFFLKQESTIWFLLKQQILKWFLLPEGLVFIGRIAQRFFVECVAVRQHPKILKVGDPTGRWFSQLETSIYI